MIENTASAARGPSTWVRADVRAAILVGALALLAFALRVGVFYSSVILPEYVAFSETDAWYHMRLVDALVRNFPHRIWQDAYLLYPGGEGVNAGPLFDWIIAGTALVLGAGAPSERLVDLVGAFVPPVIGAATILPVYVLGRDLFSRNAGVWAALAAAVVPSQLLARSTLGFTDHHCAEVLFSTLALMFVVRGVDPARSGRSRRWQGVNAGLSLSAYLLTWGGGALFVFLLAAWGSTEVIVARVRGDDSVPIAPLLPALAVPAIVIVPWLGTRPYFAYDMLALLGALVLVLGLLWLARVTTGWDRGTAIYVATIALVFAAVATAAWFASRASLVGLRNEIARLSPWRTGGYVSEATPLMASRLWRPVPLWHELTTSLFLGTLGLFACARHVVRASSAGTRLLVMWTVAMVAATFGQVRFSYYLAVCAALCAGYACDLLFEWMVPEAGHPDPHLEPAGHARAWRGSGRFASATLLLAAAIAGPSVTLFAERIAHPAVTLPEYWFDALQWMRLNTPEPFGDPDAYYRDGPSPGGYGVLTWWDWGYLITRVARRIPTANPRQSGVRETAEFFLAEDPARAADVLERVHARYVVVDPMLQVSLDAAGHKLGMFAGIARALGRSRVDYCQFFRRASDGASTEPVLYCSQEYYRTMAIRLYAFGGKAVTPRSVWVVDLKNGPPAAVAEITAETSFDSYDEALRFTQSRPWVRSRIVSKDLLTSCVPLQALTDYGLVFHSMDRQAGNGDTIGPPAVQVYEYRSRRPSAP